jgi:serine/threonine protein kinase
MTADLDDLLDQWEEARRCGTMVTAEELCRECPELLSECRRQMAAISRMDGWIDIEPVNGTAATPPSEAPRYQTLRLHAKGGLGEVYLARDHRLGRPVALKRLQSRHAGDTGLRQRFLREAAVTACLQHPGIVPVYDLTETADGQPTYAMRFISGDSLAAAIAKVRRNSPADFQSSPFRSLLRHVIDACNAVAYAHDRGIVHRDLKPANILLGAYGETLVVDWGMAKEIGGAEKRLGETALGDYKFITESVRTAAASDSAYTPVPDAEVTLPGEALGTLAYMSPEQAAGTEVSPATDVYSLGATIYHVLTGQPPVTGGHRAGLRDRIVRADFARPRQLKSQVPVALEAICLKAMSNRPADRYPSALALAADLDRWLADESIAARPDSVPTKAARWFRRHGKLVTAAAVLMASGLIALAVSTTLIQQQKLRTAAQRDFAEEQRRMAATERDHARKEREMSESVRSFLQNDLLRQADVREQANSILRGGGSAADTRENPTILTLLDRASKQLTPELIEQRFPGQPEAQASILVAVGDSYLGIGQYSNAIAFLRRGSDQFKVAFGSDDGLTLRAYSSLTVALRGEGEFDESIRLGEQVRDAHIRVLGPNDRASLAAEQSLALAYTEAGRPEGQPLLEKVRDARIRLFGPVDLDSLSSLTAIANIDRKSGRMTESIRGLEQVRDARSRLLGAEHPDTLSTLMNLAAAYYSAGRTADSIRLGEQIREPLTRLGPDHPNTLTALNNLASAYREVGRYSEAIPIYEQVRDIRTRVLGPENGRTLISVNNLASAYRAIGREPDAIRLLEPAYDILVRKLGAEHQTTLAVRHNIAEALWSLGTRLDDATTMLENVRDVRARRFGPDHTSTQASQHLLALVYRDTGRLADAIGLLEKSRESRVKTLGLDHPDTLVNCHNLASTYLAAGRVDEAIAHFEQVRDVWLKTISPNDPKMFGTQTGLGSAYLRAGRFGDAEQLFRDLLATQIDKDPDRWMSFQIRSLLGEALFRQEKYTDAEPLLLEGCNGLRQRRDSIPRRSQSKILAEAHERLVNFYSAWNKPDEVAKWRKELDEGKATPPGPSR